MVVLIALIVIVIIAIGVVVLMVIRRRKSPLPAAPPIANESAPSRPAPAPMTDLEAALANVTDRSGRPLQEHIDAESGHVDELRVPNDTGPLLRRALDSVSSEHDPEAQAPDDVGGGATAEGEPDDT